MSALDVVALVLVGLVGAVGGWGAAEVTCRRRWRRARETGSLPLRARHAGPRRPGPGQRGT
ncbi:MAG: hypothetical protein L0I76_24965 [Pseudonocardia sp.]|nr:hypothetical protein [Pseudonocardia sp.]